MTEESNKFESEKVSKEVIKTDEPIPKENIGTELLIFLVKSSGLVKKLRDVFNFSLEFNVTYEKGLFKFNLLKNDDTKYGSVEFELTGEDLKEFIAIYKKNFPKKITDIKKFMSELQQLDSGPDANLN
jgi:hypothetical protein